jgi:hypothetical protein
MDVKQFTIFAVLGLPLTMIVLLAVLGKFLPTRVLRRPLVQGLATVVFLSAIGLPVAAMLIDGQGDYFDDRQALVGGGLGLPADAEIPGRRGGSLGDCWSNQVNWWLDVKFGSAERVEAWFSREPWREPLSAQIADYFATPLSRVTIAEGALNQRHLDPRWEWRREPGQPTPDWVHRRRGFFRPFVCVAIDGPGGEGGLTLRPCDPILRPADIGTKGRVILHRSDQPGTLEGHIHYLGGPAYCTNPLRRALNDALGLPHPPGTPTTLPRISGG